MTRRTETRGGRGGGGRQRGEESQRKLDVGEKAEEARGYAKRIGEDGRERAGERASGARKAGSKSDGALGDEKADSARGRDDRSMEDTAVEKRYVRPTTPWVGNDANKCSAETGTESECAGGEYKDGRSKRCSKDSKENADKVAQRERGIGNSLESGASSLKTDGCEVRSDKKEDHGKAKGNGEERRERSRVVTFASASRGETYTDASLTYPKSVPPGGRWRGYFENVTKQRKDRKNSNRVQETFYLFFNSTPLPGAVTKFNIDGGRDDEGAKLPEGHLHVRGMGTNPFGTFEIIGGYDPATCVLTCQRMYIVMPEVAEAPPALLRGTRSPSPSVMATRDRSTRKRTSFGGVPAATADPPGGGSTKKSYGTRKRGTSFSWQKRSFFGEESDDDKVYGRGVQGGRKRQRSTSESSGHSHCPGGIVSKGSPPHQHQQQPPQQGGGAGAGVSSVSSSTGGGGSVYAVLPTASAPSSGSPKRVGASAGGAANSAAPFTLSKPGQPAVTIQRPPPQSSPRSSPALSTKKSGGRSPTVAVVDVSGAGGGGATTPPPTATLSPSSVASMKLPPAGDPKEARWRSAHYLYYQRTTETGNPQEESPVGGESKGGEKGGGGPQASTSVPGKEKGGPAASGASGGGKGSNPSDAAASPVVTTTTSFVVYEGEMNHGGCMREGRGACLFNDGLLYEGDWRKNKEHGRGRLVIAEDRRTVYDGEWERGRMHGRGVYYYHMYRPGKDSRALVHHRKQDLSDPSRGGMYEGDFKENSRHGFGKYTLPDGSSYDGEWRDNVPTGRGIFRWTDGSVFSGQWKDGKRHGIGTLQAADGFQYEGSWVKNTMEGRGVAIYPGGQRYEGSWSCGRREGRGTLLFTNGAVYEGRFRDDLMEGQGTLKMTKCTVLPGTRSGGKADTKGGKIQNANKYDIPRQDFEEIKMESGADGEDDKDDWIIPIQFQSDMEHIHQKAGFTTIGE